MVMKPEPWSEALTEIVPPGQEAGARLIVPTPSGRPFTQRVAEDLATASHLVFAPARYEGIDRRFIEAAAERMPVEELSIGDYVLAGGEVAVLVMVEAVGRLLPGVLGNAESAKDDSFGHSSEGGMAGLLEGPVYTKPANWDGREVPPVLLSGNHALIARWRRDQALERTAAMRPDLIAALDPAAPGQEGPGPAGGFGLVADARRISFRPRRCVRLGRYCLSRCLPFRTRYLPAGRALPQGDPPTASSSRKSGFTTQAVADLWRPRGEIMDKLSTIDELSMRIDVPAFRPGDTVNVHVKVVEGNRSRIQQFKGVVIRRQGSGVRETFTVRKVSFSVGVERTFPLHTPIIEKIEVVTRGDVRRAKLYYLRDLRGKKAKIKEKREAVAGH